MGTWKALKDKHFSPDKQAQIRAEAEAEIAMLEAALAELRQARALSQSQLAEAMGMKQSSVSKIERQTDMYVSTLRNFITAMGGELDIVARFPDAPPVRIIQFASDEETTQALVMGVPWGQVLPDANGGRRPAGSGIENVGLMPAKRKAPLKAKP